jgi:phosphopantothenoylcysteine decarboxylase/phosphopantothenate--cysteine ligase
VTLYRGQEIVATRRTNSEAVLRGRKVLVGVTGGIAAYKAAALVSRLVQEGADVSVVMTEAATRFVGPLTFQTLTSRPVYVDQFAAPEVHHTDHIALTDRTEIVAVAPATANIIGKLAHGIADDLLSTLLLAVDVPVLMAPAMNVRMWNHPAVQANVAAIGSRGVRFVGPATGRLACGTSGKGRMAEPDDIFAEIVKIMGSRAKA